MRLTKKINQGGLTIDLWWGSNCVLRAVREAQILTWKAFWQKLEMAGLGWRSDHSFSSRLSSTLGLLSPWRKELEADFWGEREGGLEFHLKSCHRTQLWSSNSMFFFLRSSLVLSLFLNSSQQNTLCLFWHQLFHAQICPLRCLQAFVTENVDEFQMWDHVFHSTF